MSNAAGVSLLLACGAVVGPPRFTRRSLGAAAAAVVVGPLPFAAPPLWPRPALAAASPAELLPAISSAVRPAPVPALCAPAVSVIRLPQTGQTVVLVGTAHISEDSATLVRQVIRTSRPEAVMVELDAGRASSLVQRIGASAVGPAGEQLTKPAEERTEPGGRVTKPGGGTTKAGEQGYSMAGVARRLLRGDFDGAGAEVVGLGISQLYRNLDSMGFRSGGEFVAAIEEAKAIGATVVLGDQDASITLARLRDAIKQLAADGTLQRMMAEANSAPPAAAPPAPALRKLIARTGGALVSAGGGEGGGVAVGGGGMRGGMGYAGGGDGASDGSAGGVLDSRASVEAALGVMQERENVRALVELIQDAAPPLYQALIADRDAYLARSLRAALADTGGGATRLRSTVVGVVGLAHMDGIEAALTGGGGGFDAGFGLVVPPLAGAVAAKPAACQRSPGP